MTFIGLDGCRGGWVVVTLSSKAPPSITAISSIADLRRVDFISAAIDIPIGLPVSRMRDCDKLARQYLAEHASRVFTGIRRDFLDFGIFGADEHQTANNKLRCAGEPGVSIQLWNILPKVAEVEFAMRSDPWLRERLRETHPELVFRRLSGGRAVETKKSPDGINQRLRLLTEAGLPAAKCWISRSERRRLTDQLQRSRMSVQPDDIVDACAAAIAARDPAGWLPEGEAPRDSHGLPMQICF